MPDALIKQDALDFKEISEIIESNDTYPMTKERYIELNRLNLKLDDFRDLKHIDTVYFTGLSDSTSSVVLPKKSRSE